MDDLKPCPFCGDTEPITPLNCITDASGKWGNAVCGSCLAHGPEVRAQGDWHERAIAAWNQRAEPPKEGGAK